jgi:pyridoxal phosphate enzyme (YggS family)
MLNIKQNLLTLNTSILNIANDCHRDPESIVLLAVSKRHSIESIKELHSHGQNHFGENFVQEGVDKISAIKSDKLCWHFIGHIQSNKTRLIAEHFNWVHTVDRIKIAERLSKQRPRTAADLNVCVQVNIDQEESKSGVNIDALLQLCKAIDELPKLKLRGLMCIPVTEKNSEKQRKPFAKIYQQQELLIQHGLKLDTLSMGMTNDFEAAIKEGATIIRVGTALFGSR